MKRKTRIILLDEADDEYKRLNEIVGQQIKESKQNTEEMQLLRSIKQKIDFVILLKLILFMAIIFLKRLFLKNTVFKTYGELN